MITILLYHGADLCNTTLTHPNVKALYERKYDLVIVEIFGTDSLVGLGQKFNAPVIGFSTFSTTRWSNDLIGNPAPLSYVSHPMVDLPDKMNFWHRMLNTVLYVYESIVLTFLHHPLQVFISINLNIFLIVFFFLILPSGRCIILYFRTQKYLTMMLEKT